MSELKPKPFYFNFVLLKSMIIYIILFLSLATYKSPGVEMHGRELAVVWLSDVDIEWLALVDEGPPVGSHLKHNLLGDLPHCLVQGFQVGGNAFDILKIKKLGLCTIKCKICHGQQFPREESATIVFFRSIVYALSDLTWLPSLVEGPNACDTKRWTVRGSGLF